MHYASTDSIVAEIADEMDLTFVEASNIVDQLFPSEESSFDDLGENEIRARRERTSAVRPTRRRQVTA